MIESQAATFECKVFAARLKPLKNVGKNVWTTAS